MFALVLGVVSGVFIAYLGYEMKVSYNENVEAKKFQSPTYSYCISSALVAVLNALLNGDRFMQNTGDVVALGVALASLAAGALFVYKASSDDVGTHAKRSKQW